MAEESSNDVAGAVAEDDSLMADEAEDTMQSTSNGKRKKVHFTVEFDNKLLRAVLEENPYEFSGKDRGTAWTNVSLTMDEQGGILARTCKDRCERLCNYFEHDSAFVKNGTDTASQERLGLLEQVAKLRKDSLGIFDAAAATTSTRRLRNSARKSLPRTVSQANAVNGTNNSSYTLYTTSLEGNDESKNAIWITNDNPGHSHSPSATTSAGSRLVRLNGGTLESLGNLAIPYSLHGNSALDSDERSLVRELLEARKQEDLRRKEEMEIRREELAVKKMKLEMEKSQWEAERKDREARFQIEQQERKIVLEFMRKTLLAKGEDNSSSQPSKA